MHNQHIKNKYSEWPLGARLITCVYIIMQVAGYIILHFTATSLQTIVSISLVSYSSVVTGDCLLPAGKKARPGAGMAAAVAILDGTFFLCFFFALCERAGGMGALECFLLTGTLRIR
jgi:hypothetical protein